MLQAIRERASGFVAWVIIILISVPFAFWGIQNYFDVGQETPVATVGDKEFFQRDVNRLYQQNTQNPLVFAQFSEEDLRQQALEQLINNEIVARVSSDLGFKVSDQNVRDFNKSLPYFQTDGKFDKRKYQMLLSSEGQSSAGFAEKVRRNLAVGQYQKGITDSDFATEDEVNRILELQNQEREVDYVVVPLTESDSAIDDSTISEYYQTQQQLFQNPEQVSIDYIELNLEQLADKVPYSEEDLHELYESNMDIYTTPERRKVSHILITVDNADQDSVAAARKKVLAIRQRIIAGEIFADLAKELSEDPVSAKNGGDLGLITPGDMEKNFEDAAFALAQEELSEPVKTAFGFHLIKVVELTPAKTKPFEDVREEISVTYRNNQAESQFYELGETLAEISYEDSGSLEPAAEALGIAIQHSEFFTPEKGEGIVSEQKIRDMAFSEDVLAGNNSEPVELTDNKVIVLRVKEHRLASAKALEDVKGEIVEILQKDAAKEKSKKLADEIFNKLGTGVSLADLAEQYNLDLNKSKIVTRKQTGLPREMQRAIFKAPKPKEGHSIPVSVELKNGEQAVIDLLVVRTSVNGQSGEKDRDSMQRALTRISGQSLFSAVISQIRDRADVEVITQEE